MKHPTQRLIQHVRWLCKWFGGASVIDPFMGSGTAALACMGLGLTFTGIEIEERYCEIAAKRLSQEVFPFTELMGTAMADADADAERVLRGTRESSCAEPADRAVFAGSGLPAGPQLPGRDA